MTTNREITEDPLAIVHQSIESLRKHAHAVFLAGLLLSSIGIVGVSLMPNLYRATTTILVDPQKIPERYVSSTITTDPNAHLNMLTQQVLSASRLQEIVDQDNLYPKLRQKYSREELLDTIRAKIKIELKQSSDTGISSFTISYVDENRWLVAKVANQLAATFIDWNNRSRQQQALVTTEFLSNELEQAQKSLQEQEAALQSFRLQHTGATPDQLDANLQAISRLQSDVQSNRDSISRLDQERILLSQQKRTDVHDATPSSERERLTLEKNRLENELQDLRRQYTDTYPDVVTVKSLLETAKSRLAALPAPVPGEVEDLDPGTRLRLSLINGEIDRHKQQIADVQKQISSYQGKVQSVPILETELAELTRNYETSRQNYQALLDKRLSAGMSEDLERKQQAERFTVLDAASTPEKPFKPKRAPFMVGAVVGSFLLSAGVVILLGILKGAIRSEGDLIAMLPPKVAILATIPPIITESDTQRARRLTMKTVIVSLIACGLLVAFLLKVRPIL
jgi:polysaccharide chain length determinant protein (PEP-CTERM system associated)